MKNLPYKDKTINIKRLALLYTTTGDASVAGELYIALQELVTMLYYKHYNHRRHCEFIEDVVHDVCTVCLENLQSGSVDPDSGWSIYLTTVLRNRLSRTHPLHALNEFWRRKCATEKIKNKILSNKKLPDIKMYDVQIESLCEYMSNIPQMNVVKYKEMDKEVLLKLLCVFVEGCRHKLPFKSKGAQNMFLYFSVLSLFDVVFIGAIKHSKKVFPKRYMFLVGMVNTYFRRLVKGVV